MAAYDLEEQEQLDELKTWWKMHGNLVTSIALAVALVAAAWQGWNWWQRKQSAEASALFAAVQQAVAAQDAKRSRDLSGELIGKYSGTDYAGMAALLSARTLADSGDVKTASAQLAWAAENAKDVALRDLARLRYAAALADEKDYEGALKQLATEPATSFGPRYAELKGDILGAQGKLAEAKAAYESALAKFDQLGKAEAGHSPAYRDVLQTKLDSLGSAK